MTFKTTLLAAMAIIITTQTSYARCEVETTSNGQEIAVISDDYPNGSRKPYRVKGSMYVPITDTHGFTEEGVASWYGRPFHGRKTANGEIYNMFDYTAAHPTLPIPSCVRVTNVQNGKSIIVRINDRGPFKSDHGPYNSRRVIDMSLKAAIALDYRDKGLAEVKVEALPTYREAEALTLLDY